MKMLRILLFFALLAIVACGGKGSQSITPANSDQIIITNGTIVDGRGSQPIHDGIVVIVGNRITMVGKAADYLQPINAQVIDAAGGTILPGFINAHVHDSYDDGILEAWAQGGVTTVRDEQVNSDLPLAELMALRDGWNENPQKARLVSAGFMFTVPAGYGLKRITSPENARQEVLAELAAGVDLIKLSMEDGYAGVSGLPKLSDDELDAIVSTAHEQGALVSGHVTQAEYLEILIEAGVDDIAHIPYDLVSDQVWQRMVEEDIYLTPTFTVYRNFDAPVSTCVTNLSHFIQQGGKVALGSDYGGGPGEFELGIPMYEIEQMNAAGMTPMQIIVASTLNAAHVVGLAGQIGTLEVGKTADVLIIQGNPLEELNSLRNVQFVIHNGMIIRNELQKSVDGTE